MAATLYGIRNCDTMKKAWTWLDEHGVVYDLHDYKKQGIDRARLQAWVETVGWEVLLNRAGTTFRNLPPEAKANVTQAAAIELMIGQPSMIKRPVLDLGGRLVVGYKPHLYAEAFGV
jgi:arsenate reductase (glutaredoxin)